jgi:hypothetical protein
MARLLPEMSGRDLADGARGKVSPEIDKNSASKACVLTSLYQRKGPAQGRAFLWQSRSLRSVAVVSGLNGPAHRHAEILGLGSG